MRSIFIPFVLAALALPAGGAVDYNFDVKPILSDRCFHCHGPDGGDRKAKLRLDTAEGARAVLEDGEFLARISSKDPDEVMPPPESNLKLTPAEIAVLKEWVDQGAGYKEHWSFLSVKRPEPPAAGHAVDAFVRAKLASEQLEFQPEASPEQLIRRVAFDLSGLPPTIEEIDTFLADKAEGAYERMVDRYLAKKSFGERLGSHWMDISRYSDTYGYQVDRNRHVWPWRDWVIKAFNDNMPYDRFVTEQLSGDMLPNATDQQRLATTFNRLHPQKVEGGSVEEEFRVEYVADRVHTFGTAFLGLTLECARCHDHKYDPISAKEYYQFFSYFQNIPEAGLYSYFTPAVPTPTMRMKNDAQKKQESELREKVAAAERVLKSVPGVEERFEKWAASKPVVKPDGELLVLDFEGKPNGGNRAVDGKAGKAFELSGDDPVNTKVGNFNRWQPFSVSLWMQTPDVKDRAVVFHRSRAWTDSGSRGYQLLLEEGRLSWSLIHFWPGNAIRIRTKEPVATKQWVHVAVSSDGSSRAGGLKIHVNGREAEVEVVADRLYKGLTGGGGDHIAIGQRFRDRGFTKGLVDEFRVYERELSYHEVQMLSGAEKPASLEGYYRLRVDPQLAKARESLKTARQALAKFEEGLTEIMVMEELPEPKPAYVMNRGAYDQPGEPVTASTLAVLPGNGGKNRLELARWLTARENPLTARVTVNRFWQMVFGDGLVRTPEDFGSQGALPTHPELLDWLSAEFMESGWDVKKLFRLMLTSAAYRQSSEPVPALIERDPENMLLARASRHRLPAEMLRDSWLHASGLLADKVGGASVRPYELTQSFKPSKQDKGEGLYRRSLYTFWQRTAPAPVMMALDASKRDVCTVKRERTSTPLQALVLLNDPQVNEAARVLGEKMLKKHGAKRGDMFEEVVRIATGRRPRANEVKILSRLYDEQRAVFAADPAAAEAFLKTGDAPRDESLAKDEAAAAGALVLATFNLWESVAKF